MGRLAPCGQRPRQAQGWGTEAQSRSRPWSAGAPVTRPLASHKGESRTVGAGYRGSLPGQGARYSCRCGLRNVTCGHEDVGGWRCASGPGRSQARGCQTPGSQAYPLGKPSGTPWHGVASEPSGSWGPVPAPVLTGPQVGVLPGEGTRGLYPPAAHACFRPGVSGRSLPSLLSHKRYQPSEA